MRGWRALATAERVAIDALMAVAIAILPLMALAITFEVVMRYFFNAPTIWVIDASAYALLWVAFLSAPWLIRHEGHIRIDFVTARIGPWARSLAATATALAGATIMTVVLWQTANETIQSYVRNTHTIGSWEIPRTLIWFVMPIGSFFTVLEFLRSAWVVSGPLRGVHGDVPTSTQPSATTGGVA